MIEFGLVVTTSCTLYLINIPQVEIMSLLWEPFRFYGLDTTINCSKGDECYYVCFYVRREC